MSAFPLRLAALLLSVPLIAFGQEGAPPQAPAPAKRELPAVTEYEATLQKVSDTGDLLQLAGELRQAGDLERELLVWKRLSALRPHIGAYRYELAAAQAQLGRKSETYTTLLEMQTTGFAHPVGEDPRFQKVADTEAWQYIVEGFKRNGDSFGEGSVAYTLPKQDLLIESLVWDPSRERLLVGSVREGKVYTVEADGRLKPLVEANTDNGMWGVFGVAVDVERDTLWVASSAVPHYRNYDAERDLGRAGIFKFKLSSGEFVKSFLSPVVAGQGFMMASIAVAKDGSVYAMDAVNNAIYQVRDDQLRRLLHGPHLAGVRGLAINDEGTRLYFSDVERGLLGVDLGNGRPFDVGVPGRLTLAGIESMAFWNGHLVIVQNGLPPNRIMRLKLSEDGRVIEAAHPLEASQKDLSLQVGAALAPDGSVYVIGNSQREQYDRFGLPRNREALEAPRIFRLKADYAMDRIAPSMPNIVR